MPNIKKNITPEEILSNYIVNSATQCHEYQGKRNIDGYGECYRNTYLKQQSTHRLSYAFYKGPIGKMHVLHSCDNPCCINPNHLFLGTHQDNMKDKAAKGRVVAHKGERHFRTTLTEADVIQIRQMKANKVFRSVIANKFGISKASVDDITNRHTWKHI